MRSSWQFAFIFDPFQSIIMLIAIDVFNNFFYFKKIFILYCLTWIFIYLYTGINIKMLKEIYLLK